MTSATSRSIRFAVPSFETSNEPSGMRISVQGGLETTRGPAAIRQALRLLLTTRPGERVMRPSYGCPLDQLLFEPNDDTTAGLALHFVRQAVALWEPRVEILQLDAQQRDPFRLDIYLEYRVRDSGVIDRMDLALGLLEASR